MMIYKLLFKNYLVFAPMCAYIITQVLKTILYSLMNHRFEYKRLFGAGGMPSSHSATVAALAVASFRKLGPTSPVTAVSLILALIVIYDARGVRRETGKHAQVLNTLLDTLRGTDKEHPLQLNEMVGHSLFQVIVGCLIGLGVTLCIPVF